MIPTVEDASALVEHRDTARRLLAFLSERDRLIVEGRLYGVTFKELAGEHGITTEAVRQREIKAYRIMSRKAYFMKIWGMN